MKRLLTTTIFAAIMSLPFVVLAQQQQGDLAIQFSGNYYSQKVEFGDLKIRTYTGNIYVKMGKFFTQNLELGVKPNVSFFPKDFEVDDEGNTDTKLGAKRMYAMIDKFERLA